MARYKLIVLTNAVDGQDDSFNEWYDKRHLADVVALPGFVGAERFQVAAGHGEEGSPHWGYLAIYEIETDDLKAALAEMNARAGTDAMPLSPALDMTTVWSVPFEPVP